MKDLIDIPITISNEGSYTTSWKIDIGESSYYVLNFAMTDTWAVEKHDSERKYYNMIRHFRCKDHLKALNKGLIIVTEDYKNTP